MSKSVDGNDTRLAHTPQREQVLFIAGHQKVRHCGLRRCKQMVIERNYVEIETRLETIVFDPD